MLKTKILLNDLSKPEVDKLRKLASKLATEFGDITVLKAAITDAANRTLKLAEDELLELSDDEVKMLSGI